MGRYWRFVLIFLLFTAQSAFGSPNNTMSIAPSAVNGTTIDASDENSRNSSIVTTYNAHSHVDITAMTSVNTFTIGDNTAGDKTYAVDTDQSSNPAIRFQTTPDLWVLSEDGTTFDSIGLSSGSVIAGQNQFRIGDGTNTGNKRLIANEATTKGEIRWNTANNAWEMSFDATNFTAIGTISGAITIASVREFNIGDATDNNVTLFANNSDTNKPYVRYDAQDNRWVSSNDGLVSGEFSVGLRAFTGSFTRDTNTASGTQEITGVGFQPVTVMFAFAQTSTPDAETSFGFDDGTNSHSVALQHNINANDWDVSGSSSIFDIEGSGVRYEGTVSTFNSDGFTITWTRVSTPAGTITIKFWALG